MLVVATKEQVQFYRDHQGFNQSELKALSQGVDKYIEKKEREAKRVAENQPLPYHFIVGDLVDTYLFMGKDVVESMVHVSNSSIKISDTMKAMVNQIFMHISQEEEIKSLEDYPELIEQALNASGYQANWKLDTRINKVIQEGQIYFQDLIDSLGKTYILSLEEYTKIEYIVDSLKNNPRTYHYFDNESFEKDDSKVVYYQLPIFFSYEGYSCKGLIDRLEIELAEDGTAKTVQLMDLKTIGDYTVNFPAQADNLRYDIQLAFYTEGLLAQDLHSVEGITIPKITEDTEFLSPCFIVESTSNIGKPLTFICHSSFLSRGKMGDKNPYKPKPGFKELLEEYAYQLENGFMEDSYVTRLSGKIPLSLKHGNQ